MGELVAIPTAEPAAPRGLLLDVAAVEVGQRLREVDADWAEALAVSIERDGGLIHPIEVRVLPGGRHRLVVGAHRLAAYRLRGWMRIEAIAFQGSALDARAREIAENVMRRELSPFDRAAFVAELYEVERERAGLEGEAHNNAVGAKARWARDASDMMSDAYRLQDQVAAKVGFSTRTLRRELELHIRLNPAVRLLLAGHPVCGNAAQLRLLARQPDQVKVARLLKEGVVATVAQAVERLSPSAPLDAASKHFNTALAAFSRLSVRDQRRFLRELQDDKLLPQGVKISFERVAA